MFKIKKEFHFSASHQLDQMPEGHQCNRLHGHNYVVVVELAADSLDRYGFVLDYGELAPFKAMIDDRFDHRHLNDILPVTTAEFLAHHFYHWCHARWPQTVAVHVSETQKTWASYEG